MVGMEVLAGALIDTADAENATVETPEKNKAIQNPVVVIARETVGVHVVQGLEVEHLLIQHNILVHVLKEMSKNLQMRVENTATILHILLQNH